jgi:HTH-type transcriptional regulator/antitoxin HigA
MERISMSATITKRGGDVAAPTGRYMRLIRQFPLRPISSKAQLKLATEILDNLFGREGVDLGESDYVRVLAGLVEDYEEVHHPVETAALGLDVLRHLMAEHHMKQADLAQILGIGASAVSMILSGDRLITASHAKKLAARFGVDAGLFL